MKETVLLILMDCEKAIEARIATAELFLSLAPFTEVDEKRLASNQAALTTVRRAITWVQEQPS